MPLVTSIFKWKIFSNFVAFSEYPNFTKQNWAHLSNIDFKILSGLKSKQSILGSNFGANNLKSERTSAKISCPKLSTYLKRRYKCMNNGILLPKIFWPTVRKNCSSDWEKLLKFEADGQEFSKFLRSLEQFIQTKGQNNFSWKFLRFDTLEQ